MAAYARLGCRTDKGMTPIGRFPIVGPRPIRWQTGQSAAFPAQTYPGGIRKQPPGDFPEGVRRMPEFYLMDCARAIEDEIAAKMTQRDIAETYARAMRSAEAGVWEADWHRVNHAIIARWSVSGLQRVKELAHKGKRP